MRIARFQASLFTLLFCFCFSMAASSQVVISGNISDGAGGPLLSGTVYHTASFTVPTGQTLTVQPGAIVKCTSVSGSITVNGTLNVAASPANRAIFTVISDDAAGGDTNGDGGATTPAVGTWRGIFVANATGAATIDGLEMRYTGNFGFAAIRTTNASVSVTNSRFIDFVGGAFDLSNLGMPTISTCSFENGDRPGRLVPIEAIPGFTNNTVTNCSIFNAWTINSGSVDASQSITTANMMGGAFVSEVTISITSGSTLTLGPGVNVKFTVVSSSIQNAGTLICNGTSGNKVNLTVSADDSVGGDSNADGASAGTPGTWRGLQCSTTESGSILTHTNIAFAGHFSIPAISVSGTAPSFTNCGVTDCLADAVSLNTLNCDATFDGCNFDRNDRSVDSALLEDVPNFTNCTAANNVTADIMRVTSATLTVDTTIAPVNVIAGAIELTPIITVPAGITLTFEAGVIVKHVTSSAQITVNGTFIANGTAGNPCVVTTIADDQHGGDSNKDGPSTGTPASHRGITFSATSTACVLNHLILRYAGNFSITAINVVDSNPTFIDCAIEDNSGDGLTISTNARPVVTNCTFDRNVTSIKTGSLEALAGFSGNTAAGNTVSNAIVSTDTTVTEDLSLTTDNITTLVVVSQASITVNSATTLTLGQNMVFKMTVSSSSIIINGALNCLGVDFAAVTFTTIVDDSVGGDTNKDGAATMPSPGGWRGISFSPASGPSNLNFTRVRYSGNFSIAAIRPSTSDLTMTNCVIDQCSAPAVSFASLDISPVIRNCQFNNNVRSMDSMRLVNFKNLRDNTASGNSASNAPRITSASMSSDDVVIKRSLIDNVAVVTTSISVGAGHSLRIEAGCIFKFATSSASINCTGGVTQILGSGLEPVVLTVLADDQFGGDTDLNGPTTGVPASWRGLTTGTGATAIGQFRHVLIRYAGNFNIPAFTGGSPNFALDAIRVEHSGLLGIDVFAAFGDLDNFVAFDCTNGIKLRNGTFRLRHATVTACSGIGIDLSTGYTGIIQNSISYGNGSNFNGATAANLFSSNGDAALAGMNGNLDVDPMFVDPSVGIGDLRLEDVSACVGTADFFVSLFVGSDAVDATRVADRDLDGLALSDMGAYEGAPYVLVFAGDPVSGKTMFYAMLGPIGIGFMYLGLDDGLPFFFNPYGLYLAGDANNPFYEVPIDANFGYPITFPPEPTLVGTRFSVQLVGAVAGNLGVGSFTNAYRGIIQD